MINCPRCAEQIPGQLFNTGPVRCPSCEIRSVYTLFPATFNPPTPGKVSETVVIDDQASCFYHPTKKAAVVCSFCGRFLCALCDIALQEHHYCPVCIEKGQKKRKIEHLENHRTRYDSIALALAIYPMLVFYFTIITAPIALFMVFKFWKKPTSIVSGSKIRFAIAAILATVQIVGWIMLFIVVIGML